MQGSEYIERQISQHCIDDPSDDCDTTEAPLVEPRGQQLPSDFLTTLLAREDAPLKMPLSALNLGSLEHDTSLLNTMKRVPSGVRFIPSESKPFELFTALYMCSTPLALISLLLLVINQSVFQQVTETVITSWKTAAFIIGAIWVAITLIFLIGLMYRNNLRARQRFGIFQTEAFCILVPQDVIPFIGSRNNVAVFTRQSLQSTNQISLVARISIIRTIAVLSLVVLTCGVFLLGYVFALESWERIFAFRTVYLRIEILIPNRHTEEERTEQVNSGGVTRYYECPIEALPAEADIELESWIAFHSISEHSHIGIATTF